MRNGNRGVLAWLAGVLAVAAIAAPTALAGKPTTERIDLDEVFFDDFLSNECGVDVMTHIKGHIIFRTFSGGGNVQLNTLNFALTAMAGDNSYRFRDVGADHVQVKKDGTQILSIIGQVPYDFIGVLKINLTTGEVIHEPRQRHLSTARGGVRSADGLILARREGDRRATFLSRFGTVRWARPGHARGSEGASSSIRSSAAWRRSTHAR